MVVEVAVLLQEVVVVVVTLRVEAMTMIQIATIITKEQAVVRALAMRLTVLVTLFQAPILTSTLLIFMDG